MLLEPSTLPLAIVKSDDSKNCFAETFAETTFSELISLERLSISD